MNTLTRRAVDTLDDDTAQARANRLCAEQVEVALVMQEMLGTVAAARYLLEKSVSLEIAVRVLTREWQRRWREPVNVAAFEAAPLIA